SHVSCNRVLELSDKFLEVYKNSDTRWLVKFYAPWCHHCKQLEPAFAQVAQKVHNEDIGVLVARLDCTRFTSVATYFNIRGFPTILFISSSNVVEYNGDRTQEEITDFARRLSGPRIRVIEECKDLYTHLGKHSIYFVSIGEKIPNDYPEVANTFISTNWFYQIPTNCPEYEEGIYAIKSSIVDNLRSVKYRKLLAIALVEEYRVVEKLRSTKHEEFREMLEAIAHTYDSNEKIIFGWTSHVDMINSIAIQTITPLPNFIVINSTTLQYYLIEDELLPQNIISVLNKITEESSSIGFSGGNTMWYRILRILFEAITTLLMMYKGNPVLTLVVFGLPLSFLSVIIYTSCCSDILDAKEDEEDENVVHDKKD
ncbi:disulfide-isomerase TMX3-like protein, partial [Leptotrombidium deliense]